jgi:hypothetical protein
MEKLEDLPLLSEEEEQKLEAGKLPYSGLFGNSVLLRVVEEIVADPHREFRPKKLQILTASSPPSIKTALDALTAQGLLRKSSSDPQRPVYKVNLESKRLTALTHLAYAVIDDREDTNYMDEAIKDYCNDVFSEIWASHAATENTFVTYMNPTIYNLVLPHDNAMPNVVSIDLSKEVVVSTMEQWKATAAEGA